MPHPLCQSAAKSWVMLRECASWSWSWLLRMRGLVDPHRLWWVLTAPLPVFDRMFQPKIVISPLSPGTEKVSPYASPLSPLRGKLIGRAVLAVDPYDLRLHAAMTTPPGVMTGIGT